MKVGNGTEQVQKLQDLEPMTLGGQLSGFLFDVTLTMFRALWWIYKKAWNFELFLPGFLVFIIDPKN